MSDNLAFISNAMLLEAVVQIPALRLLLNSGIDNLNCILLDRQTGCFAGMPIGFVWAFGPLGMRIKAYADS